MGIKDFTLEIDKTWWYLVVSNFLGGLDMVGGRQIREEEEWEWRLAI